MTFFHEIRSIYALYQMCKFFDVKDKEIQEACGYTQPYFSRIIRGATPVAKRAVPIFREAMLGLLRERANLKYQKTLKELEEIRGCLASLACEEIAFSTSVEDMSEEE